MRLLQIAILTCVLTGALTYHATGQAQEMRPSKSANPTLVYVGTHTGAKSKGIYLFRLQTDNLEVSQNITLVPMGLAAETPSPSFLELDTKGRLLFTVNETDTGSVSVFSIDPAGKLTLLNQRSSKGANPCHLALDKEMRNLLVANCGSGSAAVLPIGSDGRLGEATDSVQFTGKSVHPERQKGPQPHGVTFDPGGRFAFVSDLGTDKIYAYKMDTQQGKLSPATTASISVKPGSGPRRLVFRPDGKYAYGLNELNSTLIVFSYDANAGALKEVQTISTLPDYFDGANLAVEAAVHPSGRYLYVSNNGHNGVVLFSIDPEKGNLTYVEEQGTGGANPIHFGIQPSAQHLAIANHDADTVLAARIDSGNGRLKPSGIFASAPSPSCVRFLPPADAVR